MAVVDTTPDTRNPSAAVLRMVGNETAKGLQIMWSHKATLLPQIGFLTFMYWSIQYFVGGGRIVPDLLPQTFLAYLAFVVAYILLVRMTGGVLEEMFTGTLEQSFLSPLPPWLLSIGRLTAALVEGLLMVLVVAVVFIPALDISLPWRWEAAVTLALTVVDAAGFALFLGGLAIIVNAIGAVVHVIWSMLLMVNGAFIPVQAFPPAIQLLADVFPTTLGVDGTRRLLFDSASLSDLWTSGSLPWTVAHAAVMVLLGWVTYQAAIRQGLKMGRLGP